MKTILANGHKIELAINLETDLETVYYDGKEISSKSSKSGGLHIFAVIETNESVNYEIEFGPHKAPNELWTTVRRNGIIVFTDKNADENLRETKTVNKNLVLILIVAAIGILLYYQGFFGPKGEIVADKGDNSSSKLGEYSYRIVATILNKGKSGNITLTADLKQGGNLWRKELKKFISSNQVEEFIITFDEVTLLGGDITYSLSSSP